MIAVATSVALGLTRKREEPGRSSLSFRFARATSANRDWLQGHVNHSSVPTVRQEQITPKRVKNEGDPMVCGFSWREKSFVRNVVLREWRQHLTADERDLALYIHDNTIEWDRFSLDATMDQMLEGIRARSGDWTWKLPPVGLTRRTLERVVSKLRAVGLLIVDVVHRTCSHFRLNLLWHPGDGTMGLSIPKRLKTEAAPTDDLFSGLTANVAVKKVEPTSPLTANMAGYGRQYGGPIEHNDKQTEEEESLRPSVSTGGQLPISKNRSEATTPEILIRSRRRIPPRPIFDEHSEKMNSVEVVQPVATEPTARALIADVIAQDTTRREAMAISSKTKDTSVAYDATWRNAWAEAYPTLAVQTWTKNQNFMVRSVLKARFQDNVPARHDFLDFAVRNWSGIMRKRFKWMTASPPPKLPEVSFLVQPKFQKHFLDAYAERHVYEELRLSSGEDAELKRMLANGINRDEAMAKVGERRALSKFAAQERETLTLQTGVLRQAEELNRKTMEERKKLMLEKSTMARAEQPKAKAIVHEPFPELDNLPPLTFPELPPFDPNAW